MNSSHYHPTRAYSIQDNEDSVASGVDIRAEEASFFFPWTASQIPPGKGTPFGAVFIVVNAALGAGLLAFPLAFYQAGGYLPGIAIELLLLPFVVCGVMVLAYAAELHQKTTYEDAVEVVCGPVVKIISEICLLLFCFGSNIAYLVIIGDQLEDMSHAIVEITNPNQTYPCENGENGICYPFYTDRRLFIGVVSLVFILPWLFFKSIGVLSYTSFLGAICCFYIAAVVTIKYKLSDTLSCALPFTNDVCPRSWPDIINAVPFICFGYQCHVSSIPVYVGLKRRSVKRFAVVVAFAVLLCFIVYTLTGTFGWLTFVGHSCINSDILRNYCGGDIVIDVARGLLAIVMATSYPILTFCGRTPLDSLILRGLRCCRLARRVEQYKWTRLRIESLIWFLVTVTLAILTKAIANVVSFTGGLAATFIFVFPGMMLIQFAFTPAYMAKAKRTALVLFACFIITIGCFIFGNSVVYTIMYDFQLF